MDYGRENVKWRHSHFIWLIKTVLVLFADASCFKLFQPVPLKYLNENGKETNDGVRNLVLSYSITIFITVSSWAA
jgi:hypothetical protein